MAKKSEKLSASVLAFERRISSSNGVFFGLNWTERKKKIGRRLPVLEKSVRGVIDHKLKGDQQDPAKLNAEIQKPNLQTVDYCMLGMDEDTLRVKFNLQISSGVEPCTCDTPKVTRKIKKIVEAFATNGVFYELARRYATNIANGRFLWRNRVGADAIEITVSIDDKSYDFNACDFDSRDFEAVPEKARDGLDKIAGKISEVLSCQGKPKHVNIGVDACVKLFLGMEVYPSQELVPKQDLQKSNKKSKFLFHVPFGDNNQAALHPQKITNAIHTIDNWHQKDGVGPISINAYGAVTSNGQAYRNPKEDKSDFYTLFYNKALNSDFSKLTEYEQNYIMAMLVRGGVFGEKKESDKE